MSTEMPPAGHDPEAAGKLQILATEHWSLLATRSLTYTESLGRVNMFLAILSGAVIALALVAQADRFGPVFIAIAILTLSVVLFTGVATISRLMQLNRDDFRWVIGMNRLRHGYLEVHPELERNFTASPYDDVPGALQTFGIDATAARGLGSAVPSARSPQWPSIFHRWWCCLWVQPYSCWLFCWLEFGAGGLSVAVTRALIQGSPHQRNKLTL